MKDEEIMLLEELANCRIVGMDRGKVEVAIFSISYNQAEYIRDMLDGFLSQKTNFATKVIIYDDASTDGTAEILEEYANSYPNLICAYLARSNTFSHPMRRALWSDFMNRMADSKYYALCEGDDFWIDPNKLQIQYDYMQSHPECTMYLHNSIWYDCANKRMWASNVIEATDIYEPKPEEIIVQKNGHPATASFFIRNKNRKLEKMYTDMRSGDYAFLLENLKEGKIVYDPRIMSVYRVMADGSFNRKLSEDSVFRAHACGGVATFLRRYDVATEGRYHDLCEQEFQKHAHEILTLADSVEGLIEDFAQCLERGYIKNWEDGFVERLAEVCRMLTDPMYLSDEVLQFVNRYSKLYIMGAGDYANRLSVHLINNGIDFEAFVVTKKDGQDEKNGKKILSLSDIEDVQDTGVLIGINPGIWLEIIESLKVNAIENYYSPFLV